MECSETWDGMFWVFDGVQNWLDHRRSQNRVMVINGNTGMGKSDQTRSVPPHVR